MDDPRIDKRRTFLNRLKGAWWGWRQPEHVGPPQADYSDEFDLPKGAMAFPLYDHWHPSGRTIFGHLIIAPDRRSILGFVPDVCPAYGMDAVAGTLRDRLMSVDFEGTKGEGEGDE